MTQFEYKVLPAPRRGEKAKGVKTTPDRFALALTALMNRMGQDGWEYLRADTLPVDERVGLTGSKTTFQSMLVFRRAKINAVGIADPSITETASPLVSTPPEGSGAPSLGAAVAPIGAAPPVGPAKDQGVAAE